MLKILKIFKNIYNFFEYKIKKQRLNQLLTANKLIDKYFDEEVDFFTEEPNNKHNEKIIWQIWFQGEKKAPLIVQRCWASVKKHCPEYKINILDLSSIKDFIEIPKFIWDKYQNKIITNAHFSDYIRTCLLDKYGGIWIDSTVYLTDKIPASIAEQDFFVFKNPIWLNYNNVPNENLFDSFLKIESTNGLYGSNWFIVSKKGNEILKKQKKLLEKYWQHENSTVHYFFYHLFISKLLIKSNSCKKIFNKMLAYSNKEPHVLQNNLFEKYDKELYEGIKKLSFIHKLTFKFNKVQKKTILEYLIKNNKELE